MNNLVVFGSQGATPTFSGRQFVTVDGVAFGCGLIPSAVPAFDPDAPESVGSVLVRVTAFSCNYRDKAFVRSMRAVPSRRFSGIGSEFAGEVVAVGAGVVDLTPGDRVVSNHHFAGRVAGDDGVRDGVASNQASRGHHLLAARKLRRVPEGMPDDVAATFSLNGQTAFSMVRRLELRPGTNVLVTSAASNTSLFILAALAHRQVNVYVVTSSEKHVTRLRELGVRDVHVVGRNLAGFRDSTSVTAFAESVGGFDYILDPFFDLHVDKAVELLNPFGKYITCGLVGQNEHVAASSGVRAEPPNAGRVLGLLIVRNLSIIGNCIGLSTDLDAAMGAYVDGRFRPVIDSVYTGEEAGAFLDRTFNDSNRFGKVVFRYTQ